MGAYVYTVQKQTLYNCKYISAYYLKLQSIDFYFQFSCFGFELKCSVWLYNCTMLLRIYLMYVSYIDLIFLLGFFIFRVIKTYGTTNQKAFQV
jgi:hypothetical protein